METSEIEIYITNKRPSIADFFKKYEGNDGFRDYEKADTEWEHKTFYEETFVVSRHVWVEVAYTLDGYDEFSSHPEHCLLMLEAKNKKEATIIYSAIKKSINRIIKDFTE